MKFVIFPGLSRLHAENCGIAILNPGWIHPKRNLDTSVLILGKRSRVELEEDEQPLCVRPECFCILTAEHTHRGRTEIREQASYYWMHFKCDRPPQIVDENEAHAILNNRALIEARLPDALLLPQEFAPSNAKVFQEMFHDLLFEQENPSFAVEKFQILFRLMMIKVNEMVIAEHIADERVRRSHAVVYSIIQQVCENLTDVDFSVKSLAHRLRYNPDYLERLFKSVMCKSIEEYLIDRRIQYSVNRLIETSETMKRIAFESGFGSKRNYLRQFKERKQMTPSQLRLRYRMMHITNR